jgi:hypothetical protein
MATYNLAPGYTKLMGFCAEANVDYAEEQDDPIICLPAQVSDDKDSGPEDMYNPPNDDSGLVGSKMMQDKWSMPYRE